MGKVSFHKNCNKFLFSPALAEKENYLNSNSQRIVKKFRDFSARELFEWFLDLFSTSLEFLM